MKTVTKILMGCLLMHAVVASAQFSKGSEFIGGTVGYSVNARPDDPSSFTTLSVNPTFGFFIGENVALGLNFGGAYNYFEAGTTPLGKSTSELKSLSVGASIAKYFPLGDKFWFSITGGMGYERTYIETTPTGSGTDDYYVIDVHVRPAFLFFPSPKWAVTASIGNLSYGHQQSIGTSVTENHVNFGLGSIGFGLLYFFRGSTAP